MVTVLDTAPVTTFTGTSPVREVLVSEKVYPRKKHIYLENKETYQMPASTADIPRVAGLSNKNFDTAELTKTDDKYHRKYIYPYT